MGDEVLAPAYWAVVPADVRYDSGLPPAAKLLYAEITSLTNKFGYCFATNQYFAELYQMTPRNVQRLLSVLAKRGYLAIDEQRDEVTKEVQGRRIYAGINPAARLGPPADKNVRTSRQNCQDPPDKNVAPNIMNNNKYYQYPPIVPPGDTHDNRCDRTMPKYLPERFESFWKWYSTIPGEGGRRRNENRRRAVKAWDALKPDDALVDRIANALQRQRATAEWAKGIGIPQAASYLNQHRWEDAEDLPLPPEDGEDGEPGEGRELPIWT